MSKIILKYNPGSFVDYGDSFLEEFIIDSHYFEYSKEYVANKEDTKDTLFESSTSYHDFKYKLDNYENDILIKEITSLLFELEKELLNEKHTDWFNYNIILDKNSIFNGTFSISEHREFAKKLADLIRNELPNEVLVPSFIKYFEENK